MAERRLCHCPRSTEFLEINRRLRQLHPEIVRRTEETIAELGGSVRRDGNTRPGGGRDR